MKTSRRFVWLFASTALGAGCVAMDGTGNPRVPAPASSALLRSGDSLTVALQGIPDPSTHNVQIDEQELINLPYIGNVAAAGLTSAELS